MNSRLLFVSLFFCSFLLAACVTEPGNPAPEPRSVGDAGVWNQIPAGTLRSLLKASPDSLTDVRTSLLLSRSSEQIEEALYVTDYLLYRLYPDTFPESPAEPPVTSGILKSVFPAIIGSVKIGVLPEINRRNTNVVTMMLSTLTLITAKDPGVIDRIQDQLIQFDTVAPFSVLPPLLRAIHAEINGKFETALIFYEEALRRGSTCYPAVIGKARIFYRKGNFTEVIDLLRGIDVRMDRNPEYSALLSKALFTAGSPEEAEALAGVSLALQPSQGDLLFLKAEIEAGKGDWSSAARNLDEGERLVMLPEAKRYLKARILSRQDGRRLEALGLLERSAEVMAKDPEALELYGRLLLESGRMKEGKAVLESMLEQYPGRPDITMLLFRQYIRDGEFEPALKFAGEALAADVSRENRYAVYTVYRKNARNTEALSVLTPLYSDDPENENLIMEYARLLYELGRQADFLSILATALERSISGSAKSELFFLRSTLQTEPESSLSDLRSALLEDPFNTEALVGISRYYVSIKEYRKAYLFLKQAAALDPRDETLQAELRQTGLLSELPQ